MDSLFDEYDLDNDAYKRLSKRLNNGFRSPLEELLSAFRGSTRKTYLQILQMAARPEGVTTNEMSEKLGIKPQTVHPLLKRLELKSALHREKRDSSLNSRGFVSQEYFYHLASNISLEEIEVALKTIAEGESDDQFNVEHKSAKDDQVDRLEQLEESGAADFSQDKAESDRYHTEHMSQTTEWKEKLVQLRLSKLPEFNPEWSPAAQKAWFEALDRISSVSDLEPKE